MSERFSAAILNPNLGIHGAVDAYDNLAAQYDEITDEMQYKGPQKTAEVLSQLICEKLRADAHILDVGCGTGQVGHWLKHHGFSHIDGADPSEKMLEVARTKQIYDQLYTALLGVGDSRLPVNSDTYDGLTIAGSMGQNMMPCAGLHELIRVVKPGGYIVNLFREEILTKVGEYRDRLEPLIESLEREGTWRRIERSRFPDYQSDRIGIIFVHQVC